MISVGVPAGATTPSQNVFSSDGNPASAVVGTSGNFAKRCFEVTANGLSLPASTCGSAVVEGSTTTWTCPATAAASMGAVPRKGTCTISAPVSSLNSSANRCGAVPKPCDPQL